MRCEKIDLIPCQNSPLGKKICLLVRFRDVDVTTRFSPDLATLPLLLCTVEQVTCSTADVLSPKLAAEDYVCDLDNLAPRTLGGQRCPPHCTIIASASDRFQVLNRCTESCG